MSVLCVSDLKRPGVLSMVRKHQESGHSQELYFNISKSKLLVSSAKSSELVLTRV